MKHQPLRRQLVLELADKRIQRRRLEFQAKLGDAAFEQFLIAE
jgi:hypothetical protein